MLNKKKKNIKYKDYEKKKKFYCFKWGFWRTLTAYTSRKQSEI